MRTTKAIPISASKCKGGKIRLMDADSLTQPGHTATLISTMRTRHEQYGAFPNTLVVVIQMVVVRTSRDRDICVGGPHLVLMSSSYREL
jgi:hypothetical protein